VLKLFLGLLKRFRIEALCIVLRMEKFLLINTVAINRSIVFNKSLVNNPLDCKSSINNFNAYSTCFILLYNRYVRYSF